MKCKLCGNEMELYQSMMQNAMTECRQRFRCSCGYEDELIIEGKEEDEPEMKSPKGKSVNKWD